MGLRAVPEPDREHVLVSSGLHNCQRQVAKVTCGTPERRGGGVDVDVVAAVDPLPLGGVAVIATVWLDLVLMARVDEDEARRFGRVLRREEPTHEAPVGVTDDHVRRFDAGPPRSRWSSSAWSMLVTWSPSGRVSLVPIPARSYVHIRDIFETGPRRSNHVSIPAES